MIAAEKTDPDLDRLVRELVVDARAAPGAVIAVSVGQRRALGAAGKLTRSAAGAPVTAKTPWDLASVTKPFLAAAVARLCRRGALSFDTPLATLLPEARGTASGNVSIELLLAHRAGLAAHLPLFDVLRAKRPFERAPALRQAAEARRAECRGAAPSGGFAPLYSDLGYLLVGEALERAAGIPLDEIVWREVCEPLGLDVGSARVWRARDARAFSEVAPTEVVAWRGGSLRGVVHDENAWAFAGHGSAGHAGLFGTAGSVCTFGEALLSALAGERDDWLRTAELQPLVRIRPGGSLRAGFDGKSAGASAAGARAGPGTFGHLGFTGTSLWCDPEASLVSVVLSNRVCPSRDDVRFRAVRPRLQDALYSWAGKSHKTMQNFPGPR